MNMNKIRTYTSFIWTDVCNPDREGLETIASQYNLDVFQIADSLEKGHLPKYEKLSGYQFLILRAFTSTIAQGATSVNDLSNKIAFFYNGVKLITVHQHAFAFLDEAENSFEDTDHLLLFLIGKMVDTYVSPLSELDQQIEDFEAAVFIRGNTKVSLEDLYYLKTQTRITKKLLMMFQNVVGQINVAEAHRTALQDIKDRLLKLVLSYDEILENANNLLSSYHSVNAQKSNDVMKLLTIFSAFFLPLTFLAGIYGMNFEYMPELTMKHGYFWTLMAMVTISIGIYLWFKRRKIM
jgi:magnesium transporter